MTGLSLTWTWFNPAFILLLLFGLPWCALVTVFLLPADGSPPPAFVYPCTLPFAGVAVGSVYFALAGLFNRTRVHIGRNQLTTRHGPLPWIGNLSVPLEEIKILYCREQLLKSRVPAGRPWVATPVRSHYCIQLITTSSKDWSLLWYLDHTEQVMHVLQLIERYVQRRDG